MKFFGKLALAAVLGAVAPAVASAATLDDVKAKGFVNCGVSQGLIGFSNPDSNNNWSGLDVDFCRAVAAAVLGDANKVKYAPLNAKERFEALKSGVIDVLSRNSTWTLEREATLKGLPRSFRRAIWRRPLRYHVPRTIGCRGH